MPRARTGRPRRWGWVEFWLRTDQVTVAAVFMGQTDGETIKAALPQTITGEITLPPDVLIEFSDDTYRWLVGEDDPEVSSSAGDGGGIRPEATGTAFWPQAGR